MSQPSCCPVCGGKGLVAKGFYEAWFNGQSLSSSAQETCRTCGGTGIVWPPPCYAVLDYRYKDSQTSNYDEWLKAVATQLYPTSKE